MLRRNPRSPEDHYESGRRDAARDRREHGLCLKAYGYAATSSKHVERILRQEFGVRTVRVAGCRVDDNTAQYVRGYNEVMEAEIAARFGNDTLEWARVRARGLAEGLDFSRSLGEPAVSAVLDVDGWTQCPRCQKRFTPRDVARWQFGIHLSCGQRLQFVRE